MVETNPALQELLFKFGLDEQVIHQLAHHEPWQESASLPVPQRLIEQITILGEISNRVDLATSLTEAIEESVAIIVHKLKFIELEHRPLVYFLHGIEPVYSEPSDYLEQLTRLAGGRVEVLDDTAEFQPQVLIVASNQPVQEVLGKLPLVLSTAFWQGTPAVQQDNVYIVQPEVFRSPGMNFIEDLEILAEILHPGYFIFGHESRAWLSFQSSK